MSIERIKTVADQIVARAAAVKGRGEEATKQALVMPLIQALGYDIWNPTEVAPEHDADFAVKKLGQKEKVDIAILLAATPRIYFEVKAVEVALDGHEGQLARYFNATTPVTLGVLTNGVEWRFFTDTGNPNIMDAQPFHISRLDSPDQGLDVLLRFCREYFSPEAIRDYATELLYTAKTAGFLRTELDLRDKDPTDYLVRWILKSEGFYDGVVNANVVDRFAPIVKNGLSRVLREIVRRSVSAMDEQAAPTVNQPPTAAVAPGVIKMAPADPTASPKKPTVAAPASVTLTLVPLVPAPCTTTDEEGGGDGDAGGRQVVTSESELRLFALVREQLSASALANATIYEPSIRKQVPLELAYKDTTAYFGIYLNKASWWCVRGMINVKNPWIGFNLDPAVAASLLPSGMTLMEPHAYSAVRVAIKSVDDILALNRLVFAAFQKTIADREPAKDDKQDAGAVQSA
jgi:hypothetical protein